MATAASALSGVLTARRVRQLADRASFQKGRDYFSEGRVGSLVAHRDTLTATVNGTHDYAVTLDAANGDLHYDCSCPVGTDGAFCKHAVAVALAWLNLESADGNTVRRSDLAEETALVTLDDLRPWLLQQKPEALVDLLLAAAVRDERLREKLLRDAARSTGKGLDFGSYRRAIERATRTRGFIEYGRPPASPRAFAPPWSRFPNSPAKVRRKPPP
jgi:uncharacterized Zn finger protein